MAYTVKELAKISGVSVRTLHWYDEIGLLKPAYHGANSYRYYEEVQLLLLQQILFFREPGFNLNDIQKLLSQNDFDNIKALYAHRKVLEKDIARKNSLLSELYAQHPDFKKFFDVYHPKMIEFIGEAMRFYANKNL